jgi:pyruvate dehydrogenase E2 component (dihydrolipoamide acetyltransferase)
LPQPKTKAIKSLNYKFGLSMAIEILMPALSPTMTEGNLVKWLKKEGDKIKPGEVIAEIETDKATMEVESADSGILGKIVVPAKSDGIGVNQLIAILLEPGEDAKAIDALLAKHKNAGSAPAHAVASPVKQAVNAPIVTAPTPVTHTGESRIFASPLAKRIAANEGVNLSTIIGSGPHGRIVKADIAVTTVAKPVKMALSLGRNSQEYTIEPLTQIRKVIAKRLLEAKLTVPHFYLTIDCEMDNLLALRNEINVSAPKDKENPLYKISVNDFVIKASAHALKTVPKANASWTDEGIVRYNNIDISVAVAIEDGLTTPIIRNADQKGIAQISNEMKELAKRAKANALRLEEFQGGSFSISNLGMYGIKHFSAIINPPQSCILAVGAAEQRAVVKENKIEIVTMMTATISCDHRVVDGALGAELLNTFKQYIETPALMLV